MVVIALPVQIASVLIISSTTDVYEVGSGSFGVSDSAKTTYSDDGAYFAGQVALIVLSSLSYLLGTVACYRAIADTYLGRPTSARDSLTYAWSRLGATLWLSIVLIAGLVVAFLALIIPGIWLGVAWAVAYPVMLVEGTGGFGALKRSFQLTQGRWWATCGRIVVAYILVLVVSGFAAIIFVLPGEAVTDSTSFGALVLEHAGNFVISLVTTPFVAAVTTLVYFDLRVRKEGFDLAVLAERMGGAPAAGPAPSVPPPAAAPAPRGQERDAFGNPVAPPTATPPASAPPASAPGSWAPPVAPDARPPASDE